MPCFIVTNSAPKTDVSTVDYFFENPYTNMVFSYIKNVFQECLSRNQFLIYKTLCPLHNHYPQMCSWWPPCLKVLEHLQVYPFSIHTEFWPITFHQDTVIYFWVLRIINQSELCPSDQHGPWHGLLFLGTPLWGVLHGVSLMTLLLLCQSILAPSSISGCQKQSDSLMLHMGLTLAWYPTLDHNPKKWIFCFLRWPKSTTIIGGLHSFQWCNLV